jgi:molybdenum cofactor cytidylyltransferase
MGSVDPDASIAKDLATIILAAGSSSRLGQSKQLLTWQGKSLLERAIETASSVGIKNMCVVLGANEKAHRDKIKNFSIDIIHNPHWQLGIGNSLKFGVHHIQENSVMGVIVMVCDQPFLSSAHLKKMIALFDDAQKMIIASAYHQTLGVPALFPRIWFMDLLSIADDAGAKKVIQQNPDRIIPVDFPEGVIDIDSPDDITQLF